MRKIPTMPDFAEMQRNAAHAATGTIWAITAYPDYDRNWMDYFAFHLTREICKELNRHFLPDIFWEIRKSLGKYTLTEIMEDILYW